MPTIEDAKAFFFKAMLEGWVGKKAEKITLLDFPGHKGFEFKDRDFRIVDLYSTTPGSRKSAGFTTIFFQNIPVWIMHYQGEYPKASIPIVKIALTRAYEQGIFAGGRGLPMVASTASSHVYWNSVNPGMDFANFRGTERVTETAGNGDYQDAGYHHYCGMWLL